MATETQTFTANGNWTCPVGVKYVFVECYQGGSSGGAADGNPSGGGGGSGGTYVSKVGKVTQNSIYAVVVGAAIAGADTVGSKGNPSSFPADDGTIIADGGAGGGIATVNSTSVAGGAASTTGSSSGPGVISFKGGDGGTGSAGASAGGGGEGAGPYAVGNSGGVTTAGTGGPGGDGGAGGSTGGTGGVGADGTAPGGGGGGGRAGSNTNRAGGGGARGQVVLTWGWTTLQNYEHVSAPSGISVTEKIR